MSDAQSVGPFDNGGRIVRKIRIRSCYTNEGFACRCREQLSCGLVNSKDYGWCPIESTGFCVRIVEVGERRGKMLDAIELTHKSGNSQSLAMPRKWQRFLQGHPHCNPG